MIRTERVTVTREEDRVADILCNRCGQSLKNENAGPGFRNKHYGVTEMYVAASYDSPVLPDGTDYTFALCEPCIGRMFSEFAIPPEMHDSFGGMLCGGKWIDGRYVHPSDEGEK